MACSWEGKGNRQNSTEKEGGRKLKRDQESKVKIQEEKANIPVVLKAKE